ncbi:MAG: hypothetical protein A2Y86_08415 [Candidatus Aminicenantes bacterium RBG_13_62_12]|nr:MAG: hypothetical protein A2Y86_08415 [Candidatus Aminicenantes bacterium RBG_13_62_12]
MHREDRGPGGKRRALSITARRAAASAAAVLVLAAALRPQTPILTLNEVKPGLLGKGRSVFQGSRVEEFDAEILGVLPNVLPKRSIILVRLKGQGLESSGIIQGMSGSPVYVDDKLVGAVAYGFSFSKEPIAGLTPIEEMLSLSAPSESPPVSFASRQIPVGKLDLEDFSALFADVFGERPPLEADGRLLRPIGIPVVFRGLNVGASERYRAVLARMGFFPVGAAQSVVPAPVMPSAPALLRAGDPVSIQLVGGDVDVSALGTVTHVDGSRVFAFGHPLYNLGPVEFPMAAAEILTVIPSLENSFKLGVPRSVVGTFVQDRSSGAYGELGRKPSLIPVNIKIGGGPFGAREYRLQVVNDRILGPFFTSMTLGLILRDAERALGDLSLELKGNVFLENGQSVRLEDLFSGNFDAAAGELANLVLAVTYFLSNNEFQSLKLFRLDLDIQASERVRANRLEKAVLDKYEAAPGEIISLRLFSRTHRGETDVQEIQIPAPNLPAGSEFQVIIGDSAAMQQVESGQYRGAEFFPRSLGHLIRLLNNLRKNNRVYVKILSSQPGVFLKGEEMSNLPSTVKSLFTSPRASASNAVEILRSTLAEYQLAVPFVFKGAARIPLTIKK